MDRFRPLTGAMWHPFQIDLLRSPPNRSVLSLGSHPPQIATAIYSPPMDSRITNCILGWPRVSGWVRVTTASI